MFSIDLSDAGFLHSSHFLTHKSSVVIRIFIMFRRTDLKPFLLRHQFFSSFLSFFFFLFCCPVSELFEKPKYSSVLQIWYLNSAVILSVSICELHCPNRNITASLKISWCFHCSCYCVHGWKLHKHVLKFNYRHSDVRLSFNCFCFFL